MDLYRLKEEFASQNILICFNGPFSHSILEEIGIAIRNHLNQEALTRAVITDVFSVYIELTQNARNYITRTNPENEELKSTIVVVARHRETYSVTSGNYVQKTDVADLAERISKLNSLDSGGLKALYKSQIRNPSPEGENSAGLGLIEIARKSSRPMEYSIRELSDDHSFFSITAFV